MGAIFAMAKNREKTFTHSPGFSPSAAPDFLSLPQAKGTYYMERIVITSRVNAGFYSFRVRLELRVRLDVGLG
jgi:hypothetical protein